MWRVVVADQRSPRDGRVIETIGHYNAQTDPSTVVIDHERARNWIERGARPTNTVRKLLRIVESADTAAAAEDSGDSGDAGADAGDHAPSVDAEAQPAVNETEGAQ